MPLRTINSKSMNNNPSCSLSLTSVLHVVLENVEHPRHLREQQDPMAPSTTDMKTQIL